MTTSILRRCNGSYESVLHGRDILINLGLITAGCLVFIIGMKTLMVPHNLFCGGLTGIALLINYHFTEMGIGPLYFLLNIPLFALGWFKISRRFMLYSIYGTLFFSVAASLVKLPPIKIQDPLLSALAAGVVCGIGSGLILRSLGSAGGLDILVVFLQNRFGIRIGSICFVINIAVILTGLHLQDIDIAFYSILLLFTSGRVIDTVVAGFSQRKSILIISDHATQIAADLMNQENQGVTFLDGQGGYSGREKRVILTVVNMTELPKLSQRVLKIDPAAFLIVHATNEVYGKRQGKPKIY